MTCLVWILVLISYFFITFFSSNNTVIIPLRLARIYRLKEEHRPQILCLTMVDEVIRYGNDLN